MQRAPCRVCGSASSGINFGVRTCKPCASFFRRCIAERKRYACRVGNACNVEAEQRQQCRACRLRICFEVGMSRESTSSPPPSSSSSSSSSSYQTTPTSSVYAQPPLPTDTPATFAQKFPVLNELLDAWTTFNNSQRSLTKAEKPTSLLFPSEESAFSFDPDNQTCSPINKNQYERLEVTSTSILHAFLIDNFKSFSTLDDRQRYRVYKRFSVRFAWLTKIHLTATLFPHDSDNRLVVFPNFFMSLESLDDFFADSGLMTCSVDKVRCVFRAMFDKAQQIKRHFVRLRLRDIEAAFLAGSLFYDELQDIGQLDALAAERQKIVSKELFDNMIDTYGPVDAISRFASVVKFISDINKCCVYSTESMILCNLVLPKSESVSTILTVDEDCRAVV